MGHVLVKHGSFIMGQDTYMAIIIHINIYVRTYMWTYMFCVCFYTLDMHVSYMDIYGHVLKTVYDHMKYIKHIHETSMRLMHDSYTIPICVS